MPLASSEVLEPARPAAVPASPPDAHIVVRDMTMAYGSFVLMQNLNFTIRRGDIFVIMGGSGCGKSTLMRQMIGLKQPARGEVLYDGVSFWATDPDGREQLMRRFGETFFEITSIQQSGQRVGYGKLCVLARLVAKRRPVDRDGYLRGDRIEYLDVAAVERLAADLVGKVDHADAAVA